MRHERPDGALLAGVCAGTARMFGWNVWALRALFVIFLLVKTLWAVAAYALLALAMYLLDNKGDAEKRVNGRGRNGGLASPELAGRNQRIAELERRFRDLECRRPPRGRP
jgi:phage shock protein PspC (stress-responsive transcriptional regulator)